jgi:hypothetical protein
MELAGYIEIPGRSVDVVRWAALLGIMAEGIALERSNVGVCSDHEANGLWC